MIFIIFVDYQTKEYSIPTSPYIIKEELSNFRVYS